MKPRFAWLLLIMSLWMITTAEAIILDDEDRYPPPKVKPQQPSDAEREVQRLKKELAEEKRKHAVKQEAVDSPRPAQSRERGVSIEMVTLPSGMAMGKYEVTQGQWRAVMGSNPSFYSSCGDHCPVEEVSWEDVQQFIQRLNRQSGKRYRLPSEDEWFAACQAGRASEYCGSNSIDAVAWYEGNSGNRTHPVGQKQPNAWGLYDMSGNVWEWTSSCYEGDCSQRVLRGGSWFFDPALVRSANRAGDTPSNRDNFMGFRLAQDD